MRKTFDIYYSDIIGYILLTFKNNDYDVNEVSYHLINDYLDILSKKLEENRIKPIYKITDDSIQKFIDDNSDLFSLGEVSYTIIGDITDDRLQKIFTKKVKPDILKVIFSNDVAKELISYHSRTTNVLINSVLPSKEYKLSGNPILDSTIDLGGPKKILKIND